MLNLASLVQRAGSVASALANRGVPQEAVDEALRLLLGLPPATPAAAAPPPPPPPSAPAPAADAAPPEQKQPGVKVKNAKAAALPPTAFGPTLHRVLRERNVSPSEFAKRAGIRGLSKVFRRETARPETLKRFSDALGCKPEELWSPDRHARQPGAGNGGPRRGNGEAGATDGESGQPWERCRPPPGIDPGHFRAVAEEIHRHAKEHREQLRQVLAEARQTYRRETGKKLTNMHKAFRGGDYTDIPGFERIARTLADRYPEWLGTHGYERGDGDSTSAAERLFDLLTAGVPECRLGAAYKEAASLMGFFPAAGGSSAEGRLVPGVGG
jgi:hypothetical protein